MVEFFEPKSRRQIRCICSRRVLLGYYGIDNKNRPYVHLKVYKKDMIYGEMVSYGSVKIKCRECLRWHSINFRNRIPQVEETTQPEIA